MRVTPTLTLAALMAGAALVHGGVARAAAPAECAEPKKPENQELSEGAYATVKEATEGQISNLDTGSWFGLFAPAGTPPAIVAQVQKDIAAVLAKPEVRKTVEARGFIPVASTPEQFTEAIKSDTVAWQKVIKDANISPE